MRYFLLSTEWIILTLLFTIFVIRTSIVQTYITKIAASYLSSELNTSIKIDEIHILNFDEIEIKGFQIQDLDSDTLVAFDKMFITVNKIIPNNITDINSIELDQAKIHLKKDHLGYNYQFILDYFKRPNQKQKKDRIPFIIEKLKGKNISFRYDNLLKRERTFGVDYNHIQTLINQIDIKRFKLEDNMFDFYLNDLCLSEKSGFKLNKMNAQIKVSPRGIHTRRVNITTNGSEIKAPTVELITKNYQNFHYPKDSIYFNLKVLNSKIDLKEIALFQPYLKGMKDHVNFHGNISKTINNLKIKDFELNFGESSKISGTVKLPNFQKIDRSFLDEKIAYCNINIKDLENISLPTKLSEGKIKVNKYFQQLGFIEGKQIKISGFTDQFVIAGKSLNSQLGSVEIGNGVLFTKFSEGYKFSKSQAKDFDFKVNNFDLGSLVQNKSIGRIDGTFFLSGEAKSFNEINFEEIAGNLNHFVFDNYKYQNIKITEGKLIDKVFTSKINIQDDNLSLSYDGFIDFNKGNHLKMSIDLSDAILENLNLSQRQNSQLSTKFNLDIKGSSLNSLKGNIELEGLIYKEKGKTYTLNHLNISIQRHKSYDLLNIESTLGNLTLKGNINFKTLIVGLENQLSYIFPSIFNNKNKTIKNEFTYQVEIKKLNPLLEILYPNLKVNSGTILSGSYSDLEDKNEIRLNSSKISFKNIIAKDLNIDLSLTDKKLSNQLLINELVLNDSTKIQQLSYNSEGQNHTLNSVLNWNSNDKTSELKWLTKVNTLSDIDFIFNESNIFLNSKQWKIDPKSKFRFTENTYKFENFKFRNNSKFVFFDGIISDNSADLLNFKVNGFELEDFGKLAGLKYNLKGQLNGWGSISEPFNNLKFNGDVYIEDCFINNREIGNLIFKSNYVTNDKKFNLSGDLIYKNNKTFHFTGFLDYFNPVNQLNFELNFDNTDLKFLNAFLDSNVVTNIQGDVAGKINLSGLLEQPKFRGKTYLNNGKAKLALLNVNYNLKGEILCDNDGFYINKMPITDEEGNIGNIVGSAYHTNLSNWNFDIIFNLEDNLYRNKNNVLAVKPLDKFLVMNTEYSEENVYYGRGYGTGIINIFGDLKTIDIDVNLKTRAGSKINFPFYTISEIDDENNFIHFISRDDENKVIKPKLNLSGVNLNMEFNITPDAELKLILDETSGDEISARGEGDLKLSLDQLDNFTLNGSYKVKKGKYNFVMRPINEEFIIEENGTVSWTGDPYNAFIDLKCYYPVNASLNEISRTITTNNMGNQEVLCYLNLTESLLKPSISFDIVAPNTTETGQTLLNLVRSNQDMLNQQFFSLLLFKKFQSIDIQNTNSSGTGSAALDIAQGQINSMLAEVSKDYKLNVALDKNAITGGNSMALGVTKGFYNDRLIFRGSVGVGTSGNTDATSTATANYNQNPLIGDVNLEYLLNESGTFRINIFNESNQNTLLNDQLGLFTQGAGLQYHEDFTSLEEFKALQYFLDIFRGKEKKRYPEKRKKREELIVTPNKENE